MKKSIYYGFLILVIVGVSCSNPAPEPIALESFIEEKIEAAAADSLVVADSIFLSSKDIILPFYRSTDYHPAWSDTTNRNELMACLEDAVNDGLNPDDYHLSRIKMLMEEVRNSKKPNPIKLADIDLLMTDGIMLYARHLIIGKVEQSKIRPGWNIPLNSLPGNGVEILRRILRNEHVKEAILGLKPDINMYRYLRKGLEHYRKIASKGGWPKMPEGETLKPGMTDSRVITLRKYLTITGDLPQQLTAENKNLFDEEVEEAVKQFQYRHNLNQDGKVGKGNLEIMNVTVEERIEQLRINLERTRWIGYEIPDDFMVANIAGYNLRRISNDSIVYYSRVIVGKHFHETPIFRSQIKYLVLNPTWTLTYSIATKETLPKLKRDPSYLEKHNMVIMNSKGEEQDPYSIDFSKYSERYFPFTIRQNPGPKNSLGQIKFIFPNKYHVYLHDTPARSLFSREQRAFSHGCLRLDKKWDLMLSLMGSHGWDMKRINEVLRSGEITNIPLKNPIDILILYWTAGAEAKTVFFNKDIYDRDPEVLEELNKPVIFKTVKN